MYNIGEEVENMEIKNSLVTFWFQKQPNPKEYSEILNKKLEDYFYEFNTIGVPSNIDPVIPRMTAVSNSSHSNIEISLINARLNTNFDDKYNTDCDLCIEYIKERALKIFDALSECGISTIYSAIFINLEEKNSEPAKKIMKYFLKNNDINDVNEVGIKITQDINEKYYKSISVNNGKQIKIKKTFEPGNNEIILPLISLNDAEEIEDYLSISIEINDKLSFNMNREHISNKENLQEMFTRVCEQIKEELSRFDE